VGGDFLTVDWGVTFHTRGERIFSPRGENILSPGDILGGRNIMGHRYPNAALVRQGVFRIVYEDWKLCVLVLWCVTACHTKRTIQSIFQTKHVC